MEARRNSQKVNELIKICTPEEASNEPQLVDDSQAKN